MAESIRVGDVVQVFFDSRFGDKEGWYRGRVFKIDPYSEHRSFYWVELETEGEKLLGMREISVFNPKNIQRVF